MKKYALVFWPIQVNFIVGLPALTGTICEQIGKLALAGTNSAEEKRLKAILRHMFPPTIDELGHGPGQPRCVHHDLFAAQVQACTGLEQQTLRKDWIRGSANQRLANAMRKSVRSVSDGLHMMYVVESLAPRFFIHQEALFLSCSEPRKVFHSTMHKTAELEHADDAQKFMAHVDVDQDLIDMHFALWRDVADQMHAEMYGRPSPVSPTLRGGALARADAPSLA